MEDGVKRKKKIRKTIKIIISSNKITTIMKANNKNRKANGHLNYLPILLRVLFTKLKEITTKQIKLRTHKSNKKMTIKSIIMIKINKDRVNGGTNFHAKKLKAYSPDLMVKRIKTQKLNREKIQMNKKVKRRKMANKKGNGEKK